MQYVYQKSDGNRVQLSKQQYDDLILRYGSRITHMVRTKTLTICCMRGNERKWPVGSDRYSNKMGGSDRMRNPYNYMR